MNSRADLRLDGKVAIVSGAGTYGGEGVGNGAATAILMAREGARVVLVDAVLEWAEATRVRIEAEGGTAVSVVAEVTKPEDCERAVETALETYGHFTCCTITWAGVAAEASSKPPTRIGSGARRST